MNATQQKLLADCALNPLRFYEYARAREARAAIALEAMGLGVRTRRGVQSETNSRGRTVYWPAGRFLWYGFTIRRYDDPSGPAHIRTPPHWQLWRDGKHVESAPTKRELIRFLIERQIKEE